MNVNESLWEYTGVCIGKDGCLKRGLGFQRAGKREEEDFKTQLSLYLAGLLKNQLKRAPTGWQRKVKAIDPGPYLETSICQADLSYFWVSQRQYNSTWNINISEAG